jgi:peptidoglycan hydrolase CwlO-like protein
LEDFEKALDKEIRMRASASVDGKAEYTTPPRVQAWFLHRSRENWKRKYMQLKSDAKRLQNRVNDVTKSREHWHKETKELNQRIQELEAENAALQEQLAALKKDGLLGPIGPDP